MTRSPTGREEAVTLFWGAASSHCRHCPRLEPSNKSHLPTPARPAGSHRRVSQQQQELVPAPSRLRDGDDTQRGRTPRRKASGNLGPRGRFSGLGWAWEAVSLTTDTGFPKPSPGAEQLELTLPAQNLPVLKLSPPRASRWRCGAAENTKQNPEWVPDATSSQQLPQPRLGGSQSPGEMPRRCQGVRPPCWAPATTAC